jgi:hypothetical protein
MTLATGKSRKKPDPGASSRSLAQKDPAMEIRLQPGSGSLHSGAKNRCLAEEKQNTRPARHDTPSVGIKKMVRLLAGRRRVVQAAVGCRGGRGHRSVRLSVQVKAGVSTGGSVTASEFMSECMLPREECNLFAWRLRALGWHARVFVIRTTETESEHAFAESFHLVLRLGPRVRARVRPPSYSPNSPAKMRASGPAAR